MEYIAHRINTLEELEKLPQDFGVELDLRDYGEQLILQHDPFMLGEDFETYLQSYEHGTMILNIKSERIEHRVLALMQHYAIKNYFFLDSSFPMIHLLAQEGITASAVRFSEYEGLDTLRAMAGKVEWVWVDCFTKLPLERTSYDELKNLGYKLCLVSPELQGREEDIDSYRDYLQQNDLHFDAICTKHYHRARWQK
ncbi:MAG: hypothetical protein AAGB12_08475 [Pseudomonadota bacterium]